MEAHKIDRVSVIENMQYKKYSDLNAIELDILANYDTDLNVCCKCDVVVDSFTEMYWQGDSIDTWHECMKGYEALCDDCFKEVSDENNRL